ncbi:MAG: hypothetical protein ACRDSK_11385 [Actinophytocola sp.]
MLRIRLVGLDLAVEVGLERDHVGDRVVRRTGRHRPYLVVRVLKRITLPVQQVVGDVQLVGTLCRRLGERPGRAERGVSGLTLPAPPDLLTQPDYQLGSLFLVGPLRPC